MKIHNVNTLIPTTSEFFRLLRYIPKPQEAGPWIAGGSVSKAVDGAPLNSDIDFFFNSAQQFTAFYRLFKTFPFCNHVMSEKKNKFNVTFDFHICDNGNNKTIPIQLINFKYWSSIEELFGRFDFTVCQFAYDGNKIFTGDKSIEHLAQKHIVFHNTGGRTVHHVNKYLSRGFFIAPECQSKFEELTKADLEYRTKRYESTPAYPSDRIGDDASYDDCDVVETSSPTMASNNSLFSNTILSTPPSPSLWRSSESVEVSPVVMDGSYPMPPISSSAFTPETSTVCQNWSDVEVEPMSMPVGTIYGERTSTETTERSIFDDVDADVTRINPTYYSTAAVEFDSWLRESVETGEAIQTSQQHVSVLVNEVEEPSIPMDFRYSGNAEPPLTSPGVSIYERD